MKDILTHNLGLKILSVVIAFFIWLAVVNVSNPLETRSREILLEVQNESVLEKAGLAYELDMKKTTVTVTYQVHSMDQTSISSADFKAYINLADYYPATGTVPVSVEVLNNKDYLLESVAVRPGVIRVKTEQIQQKDFDLQVNQLGNPAAGYEVDRVTLHPDMVTVEGPESVIGRINAVGVEINIEGIHAQTSGTAVPVFYDANGNKINLDERVSINIEEIAYTIDLMKTKVMALEFEVSGQPAEGFRYMGMEASADKVSVIGVESVIQSIPSIKIPGSVLNVNVATENHVITFEGLKADLDEMAVSDLIVEMDVSSMNIGTYPGTLTVEGLENIILMGHSDFQVIVSSKDSHREEESETQESDEGDTPAGSSQVSGSSSLSTPQTSASESTESQDSPGHTSEAAEETGHQVPEGSHGPSGSGGTGW